MRVKEVMDTAVNPVSPSTPIIEVAHQMKLSRTGSIPICNKGRFRGLITERDIVFNVVARAIDPVTETVSSIMNKHLPVVSPDDDIMDAAKVMADSNIHILPVVQSGKLVGLLTLESLSKSIAGGGGFRQDHQASDVRRHQRKGSVVLAGSSAKV